MTQEALGHNIDELTADCSTTSVPRYPNGCSRWVRLITRARESPWGSDGPSAITGMSILALKVAAVATAVKTR